MRRIYSTNKNSEEYALSNFFRKVSFEQYIRTINRFSIGIQEINPNEISTSLSLIEDPRENILNSYRNVRDIKNIRKPTIRTCKLEELAKDEFEKCLECSFIVRKPHIDDKFWISITYDNLYPMGIRFNAKNIDEDTYRLFKDFKKYDWKSDSFF